MFLEDLGGPKKTLKCFFTTMALKRTKWRLGRCSTAAAVWLRLTAEEAEAGLVAAVRRQWWLEKRQLMLLCQLVEMAAVGQSAGSSALRVHFRRSLKVLIRCVGFLRL